MEEWLANSPSNLASRVTPLARRSSVPAEASAERVHHAARWGGGDMAACGAGAAARANAADRRFRQPGRGRPGRTGSVEAFQRGLREFGWGVSAKNVARQGPEPSTTQQRVNVAAGGAAALAPTGIRFRPAAPNSRRSLGGPDRRPAWLFARPDLDQALVPTVPEALLSTSWIGLFGLCTCNCRPARAT